MLNDSARNCSRVDSVILKFLNRDRSHRCSPGPLMVPGRALPGRKTSEGTSTNAAVLNHWSAVCGALALGSATWSGRALPCRPKPAGSAEDVVVAVKGAPEL